MERDRYFKARGPISAYIKAAAKALSGGSAMHQWLWK
jgi:hypothetical protein